MSTAPLPVQRTRLHRTWTGTSRALNSQQVTSLRASASNSNNEVAQLASPDGGQPTGCLVVENSPLWWRTRPQGFRTLTRQGGVRWRLKPVQDQRPHRFQAAAPDFSNQTLEVSRTPGGRSLALSAGRMGTTFREVDFYGASGRYTIPLLSEVRCAMTGTNANSVDGPLL